jgi:ABC-type multidrug transport system permease subunit
LSEVLENQCVEQYCRLGDHQLRWDVERLRLPVRLERPSKTYSWVTFLFGMVSVELVWNTLMAVGIYCCWYWPIGFGNNRKDAALVFAFCWEFLLFGTTLGFMIISAIDTAENGGIIAYVLQSLTRG